jgi:hypothetical protein
MRLRTQRQSIHREEIHKNKKATAEREEGSLNKTKV